MNMPALPRRQRRILPSRVRVLWVLPAIDPNSPWPELPDPEGQPDPDKWVEAKPTRPRRPKLAAGTALPLVLATGTTTAAGPSGTTAAGLAAVVTLLAWLATRRRRDRQPWADNDLTDWHPAHRDPDGDVWAVTPPCGYGIWMLYRPGSPTGQPWPYTGVVPAGDHPATAEYGGDADLTTLADVEHWMRPWVEQASGGRVVDMVEGWGEPYGVHRELFEYVIYARVAAR